MDQSVEAPWRDNRFFLPEEQLKGPAPAWLHRYKDGIQHACEERAELAKGEFQGALALDSCPPTVYIWLLSLKLFRDEKYDYEACLTPEVLAAWDKSTVAEEQNALAYCLLNGIGGADRNPEKAMSMHEKAAQQGYALAQGTLGALYFQLPQVNRTKALEYFQAAADQEFPTAKKWLSLVQKSIRLQRTREAGGWLLYPIGLLSMLLVVGFGGLANYLNPLLFANFGHVFAGTFLAAGLVSVIGLIVWTIGGLLALPEYIERRMINATKNNQEAELSSPLKRYGFLLKYMCILIIMLVIVLVITQEPNLTAILSQGLLSGLTTLAGIPGLDFISPLLTSAFTQAVVEVFCVLSPFIAYAAINRVVTTFQSDDPQNVKSVQKEDVKLREENVSLSENPYNDTLKKDSKKGQKFETIQIDSEESDEQQSENSSEYQYTPEQKEYVKQNPGQYLVRALYDFTPESKDLSQLEFKEGDLIWVLDSHPEEDWWIGKMAESEDKGYFPTNYIQVLTRKSATSDSEKPGSTSTAFSANK